MSGGVDRRSVIDTETFKALLVINGGGAVAMLGFLSAIIDKPGLDLLARAVLWGVIILALGLGSAVLHNHCRRHCSLQYERHRMTPPRGSLLGVKLWAPTICCVSQLAMWASLLAFIVACSGVGLAGILFLPS